MPGILHFVNGREVENHYDIESNGGVPVGWEQHEIMAAGLTYGG